MAQKKDAVEAWLDEFKGEGTKKVYRSVLRRLQRHLGVDLDTYLAEPRDFLGDFKSFIASLDNTPKTVILYAHVSNVFD